MRFALPMLILSLAFWRAGQGDDHEAALSLRERQEILPLEELLRQAGVAPDARILEIESELEHGRHVYEVEYVDSAGRIRKLLLDARSGAVMAEEEE